MAAQNAQNLQVQGLPAIAQHTNGNLMSPNALNTFSNYTTTASTMDNMRDLPGHMSPLPAASAIG